MTTLERIELQTGRTHTVADTHAVLRKSAADRSDLDLAIIEHFTPLFTDAKKTAAATAMRTKALQPAPVRAPAPASAPRPVTRKELRAVFDAYSDAVIKVLRDQRDTITALQQRCNDADRTHAELLRTVQQLQTQVLDLQASAAARGELVP